MQTIMALCLLLVLTPLATEAAEIQTHRDLAYAQPKNERQLLDVYAPLTGKNHPILFWIHGGGWRKGSKDNLHNKTEALVGRGFVIVSANYRFVPNVTVPEMMADIAKAIRYTHDHAAEYGGDPNSIIVAGHSAGAHLAALVCTDERYLKAEGLSLSILKGCVPVDVSVYDIPKRAADSGGALQASSKEVFGDSEESHRNLSPAWHVAKDKQIPAFLILHVADREDTKVQSQWLAEKRRAAGIAATVVAAEGKNHGTINADLGLPDDKSTQELWKFLDGVLKKSS